MSNTVQAKICTWVHRICKKGTANCNSSSRATDGVRTRDPDLGKVVLYQLSHCRIFSVPLTGTIHTILRTKRNVNTFFYFFIINCIHGLYSKNSQNFFIFSLLLKSFQLHIFSHCTSPTSMLYFLCICITQKGVLSL